MKKSPGKKKLAMTTETLRALQSSARPVAELGLHAAQGGWGSGSHACYSGCCPSQKYC